jgi:sec-independent protein translocase protein TatB
MFSIPHLIIVFVVALVVFGPEKLPELARNIGKLMGEFRRATGDLRSTFEGHLRDLEREADQRRLSSETASATEPMYSSASNAAPAMPPVPPEPPPAPPEPGTVPTIPPHMLGFGTTEETWHLVDPAQNGASENSSSESAPPAVASSETTPPALEPEHNPETLTDAGTRPA